MPHHSMEAAVSIYTYAFYLFMFMGVLSVALNLYQSGSVHKGLLFSLFTVPVVLVFGLILAAMFSEAKVDVLWRVALFTAIILVPFISLLLAVVLMVRDLFQRIMQYL